MSEAVLDPFENDTVVAGKYKVPVSFMAAPPENVTFAAFDLSWKNSIPMYKPDASAEKVTLPPLEIVTKLGDAVVPLR
jgi:hypothetical protein